MLHYSECPISFIVMLNVINHYAECRHAKYHYAEGVEPYLKISDGIYLNNLRAEMFKCIFFRNNKLER
jgi:hypothetical protein